MYEQILVTIPFKTFALSFLEQLLHWLKNTLPLISKITVQYSRDKIYLDAFQS